MELMCFLTNVLNQQSQWIKQSEELMEGVPATPVFCGITSPGGFEVTNIRLTYAE